jgi:uncharacterized membrane protein YphA (DoxX/SURF4 family)
MLTEHAHPNRSGLWRQVAGWSLLITGIGHLAGEVLAPETPEHRAMMATMRGWYVPLPGAVRNVEELFLGLSLMMGMLLFACGVLVATARPTRWSNIATVAMTLAASVMAWRYFFPLPGVLTAIAAAAAILAWWSDRTDPSLAPEPNVRLQRES